MDWLKNISTYQEHDEKFQQPTNADMWRNDWGGYLPIYVRTAWFIHVTDYVSDNEGHNLHPQPAQVTT